MKYDGKWFDDLELTINESKEDQERFINWAGDDLSKKFFAMKDRLQGKEKDIYYWMKKPKLELYIKLQEISEKQTRKQKDEEAKRGADLIYSDSEWKGWPGS